MAKRRRKEEMGFVEASLGVAFLIWLSLNFIPATKPIMRTTEGIALTGATIFLLWLILMVLIGLIVRRRRRKQEQLDLSFDDSESDPIQQSLTARKRRLESDVPLTPTPRDFEHEVTTLFNVLTSYKAIAVGGSGDGGVDIKVYSGERLVGIIQCKRYDSRHALSPGHVRELFACKEQFGVKTAYLVTTAHFTPETRREADRLGIKLIGKDKLEEMRSQARAKLRRNDERALQEGEVR